MRFVFLFLILAQAAFSQSRVTVMTGTSGVGVYPTNFFVGNSNAINSVINGAAGLGTVTSVGVSSPDLIVGGSPITTSGTITIYGTNKQPASANLTNWSTIATNTYATIGQLNIKQAASANLDSWSGTASNLWTTIGQLHDYSNTVSSTFQPLNSTLTSYSGLPTNAIPRALTNAGNSSASLINDSNAPIWKLKSLSASGATLTDQGTNILLTVTASGSGTVTSVAASSDWLNVSGSPITTSGTLSLTVPYIPQAGNSTLTNWSVTATNSIPRALTNAGNSSASLINDSNAPTWKLKSVSGSGVTITDQSTNLLFTATPANYYGPFTNTSFYSTDALPGLSITNATNSGGGFRFYSTMDAAGAVQALKITEGTTTNYGVVLDANGWLYPISTLPKLGTASKPWDGSTGISGIQPTNANLTAFSGIATNSIPRALTNAGASTGSLINDSNAPTWKLKSISATSPLTITDQSTNLLIASAGGPMILDTNGTQAVIVNTASETVLYSYIIPGGSLTNHRTARHIVSGILSNNTGSSRFFTVRVRLGGTTLSGTAIAQDNTASFATASAAKAYKLSVDLSDIGTGLGQTVGVEFNVSAASNATIGDGDLGTSGVGPYNLVSTSAKDFTGLNAGTNLLFEITVTPSIATNALSIYRYHGRSILE